MTGRKQSLAQRVAALEDALRARVDGAAPSGKKARARGGPAELGGARDLLVALASRDGPPYSGDGRRGAIAFAGVARLGEREYQWAREHALPDLASADWAEASPILVCLGSPVRLTLLRRLLDGPCDRHALQAALGETTSGQLYHHLRDLQATKLIKQRRRGEYELADSAIVPLLIVLSIARDFGVSADEGEG